ncbi:uncharacterized protein LOC114521315 isoform X2 [Dendronephthya gigantea]|uniref:uncharacterized protein LOC114521315 isoform X2 n=1 Tax=Dendronephthya gigantea TaxID=151771 RepID=UPI00106C36CF|nr:uncharacterized protein LOC114521315 isoform X2 [Dendronephthya gigantea]
MRQARDVKDKNYKLLLVNRLQQIVTGYSTSLDEVYHEESNMADAKDEVCTWGNRKFCDIPKAYINSTTNVQSQDECGKLCDYIERNCLGREFEFTTPFGKRKVVYSDYVASSKSLKFLEDYITNNVLNCYGNTHTTTTVTSLQTTLYRHEARTIIRNAVNASEHDAVIFAGSGTTAAVHKFIHALKIKTAPIVFVGPFEHHSNILPWKEIGSEIVWIREARDGNVDVDHLEEMLKLHSKDDKQLIGCFSAASNITGILTDTNKVSACLHRYGALAVWDYATAGPYTEINMNPVVTSEDSSLVYKDAVFLSPHKFVGGVGTPGILIAKKNLFQNTVPSNCGGGSVFFVTHNSHRYLKEIEMREEGGTPAIVESIRAGLVFQLKEAVRHEYIMKIENDFLKLANDVFSRCNKLIILGNYDTPRLPVFSFLIKHEESGLFLHHNFVSSLLNDLFGIQSRGGCACAGPYAQDLLGIDEKLANEIESALLEDSRLDRVHLRRYGEYSERELVRPGFTRINLPYFMKKEEALFILESIVLVAEHGWKLLPKYTFNPETGEWRHRQHQIFKDRKWLGSISYSSGEMKYPENVTTITENENYAPNYQECLTTAMEIFKKAAVVKGQNTPNDQSLLLGDAERLRWFLLPSEAYAFLREETRHGYPKIPPFSPRRRCYHGEMGASNNISKHIDEVLENTECERENCSDCKNVVDIYKGKHDKERVKSEESNLTPENSACNSLVNNREILESRHDDKDVSDSAENEKTEHCFHNLQVKFYNPPRHVFNLTVKAIEEFNMIEDGDRLLVCVSGGKDSLSMLHTLHQYQFYAKTKGVNFHIGAATVDPGSAAYDPSPLKSYMKELGIEYFYEVQGKLPKELLNKLRSWPCVNQFVASVPE